MLQVDNTFRKWIERLFVIKKSRLCFLELRILFKVSILADRYIYTCYDSKFKPFS